MSDTKPIPPLPFFHTTNIVLVLLAIFVSYGSLVIVRYYQLSIWWDLATGDMNLGQVQLVLMDLFVRRQPGVATMKRSIHEMMWTCFQKRFGMKFGRAQKDMITILFTVPRPSDQPSQSPSMPPNSLMQLPSQPPPPQTPSYRPAAQKSGPQLVMQSFPTTRPSHQMIHSQSQSEVQPPLLTSTSPFTGNPSPNRPLRFSEFANPNPIQPTGSSPRMGPQSFTQAPQMLNFPGQFPPQMMNPPQMQQN